MSIRKVCVHAKTPWIPADGQCHRMAEVGWDFWRSSCPALLLKQCQLEQVVQYGSLFGVFHLFIFIISSAILEFCSFIFLKLYTIYLITSAGCWIGKAVGGVQRIHASGDRLSDGGESSGGILSTTFNSSLYLWWCLISLSLPRGAGLTTQGLLLKELCLVLFSELITMET